MTSVSFTGQVTGNSFVGGLEGKGSGTFSSCSVNGLVEATGSDDSGTGGLVGDAGNNITFQNNCIHQGNVTGTDLDEVDNPGLSRRPRHFPSKDEVLSKMGNL